MKNRVFITGAQGFVGRYLVAHWLETDPEVEILGVGRSPFVPDRFTHKIHHGNIEIQAPLPAHLKIGSRRYKYVSLDIRQRAHLSRLLQTHRPNMIVHLASYLRGDNVAGYFETNVGGTIALMEAVAESALEITKLVIGSTGGVYGAPSATELPLKETALCNPLDLYAVSKLASEQASRILGQQHDIATVWVRLFNLIGAGQQELHVCGRFAAQVADVVCGASPRVIRVGPLDATRDFIDVRDAAAALEFIANQANPGQTYNLGSGRETSIKDVLETILEAAGLSRITIERVDEHSTAIPRHFAAIERLKLLGFESKYQLKSSAENLMNYYLHEVTQYAEVTASEGGLN
jgi:GDP-4-dehydro-6-deoxy-D-mannose reductase